MEPRSDTGPSPDPRPSGWLTAPGAPGTAGDPFGGGARRAAGEGYDVVVIDDDQDTLEALSSVLESGGYRVLAACSGTEAIHALEGMPAPRLILLDLVMPGMCGEEVVGEMRRIPSLAAVPVVLFSGLGELDRRAEQLAAAGWLRKPGSLDELLEIVQRHVLH